MSKRKLSETIDSSDSSKDIKSPPIKSSKFSITSLLSTHYQPASSSSSSIDSILPLAINNFVPFQTPYIFPKPPTSPAETDPSSETTLDEFDLLVKSETSQEVQEEPQEVSVTPTPSESGLTGPPQFVNWPPAGESKKLALVQCYLEQEDLWVKFSELGTEMIITKSGRRMFPVIKIRLEGCDPDCVYYAYIDIIPVDDRRYRYVYNKSSWLVAGKAEPPSPSRLYLHPDSPYQGRHLASQSQTISFEKAKLTNHEAGPAGHLVLNSMHKYQPRVHIVCRDKTNPIPKSKEHKPNLEMEEYKTFAFPETQFMAVTAYQNQLVTKLKIEKNPFAKGFRDTGGRSDSSEIPQSRIFANPYRIHPQAQQFLNPPGDLLLQAMPPVNLAAMQAMASLMAMQQQLFATQALCHRPNISRTLGFDSVRFLAQNGDKKPLMNVQNSMKKLDCPSQ